MYKGNKIKIDKNVPLPTPRVHANTKFPWNEMKVGDSFIYPNALSSAYAACFFAKGRYKPNIYKAAPDGKSVRIWRIK